MIAESVRRGALDARDDPVLMARLAPPGVESPIEQAMQIDVKAFDWNCPLHIPPRCTEAEIDAAVAPLREEIARLKSLLDGKE